MVGLRLALIGSIKDDILNTTELSVELIRFLQENNAGILAERYEADEAKDAPFLLQDIAKNRACLLKGGEYDTDKAAVLLIDDFRSGRLGRITLEFSPETKES